MQVCKFMVYDFTLWLIDLLVQKLKAFPAPFFNFMVLNIINNKRCNLFKNFKVTEGPFEKQTSHISE